MVKFEQVPLLIWLIYKPHVQILKLDELCMISDRLKPVNFMSYPESRINLKNLYVESKIAKFALFVKEANHAQWENEKCKR